MVADLQKSADCIVTKHEHIGNVACKFVFFVFFIVYKLEYVHTLGYKFFKVWIWIVFSLSCGTLLYYFTWDLSLSLLAIL